MNSRLRALSFFLIKCKNCIDQKTQDKLAKQAGSQQYKKTYISSQGEQIPLKKPMQDELAEHKVKGTDSLAQPKGISALKQTSKPNGKRHTYI